jgi:NADH:ubiquinone oxidoreductase subunit F (NADH-binding)
MLDELERSGLRGRGGGWFPTHRKWRSVAQRARGGASLVINASEGEPLSAKDAALLLHRPHLVLDGAIIAAESVGADELVVYLARPARARVRALRMAVRERRRAGLREPVIHVVTTAHRYIAGESSAVVRRVDGGPSKPQFTPNHLSHRGLRGRPTLVQNVETLAHIGLIARFGARWFRARGPVGAPGTALVTMCGAVGAPGVYEIELGAGLRDVINRAGGAIAGPAGVLIGGYFGTWLSGTIVDGVRLTPEEVTFGCGVIGLLGAGCCGIAECARIISYLAAETAGQCGPCVHGLRALAASMTRLAATDADRDEILRLRRWAAMVSGRGACHHPDGAVNNLASALQAFSADVDSHLEARRCGAGGRRSLPPPPRRPRRWR